MNPVALTNKEIIKDAGKGAIFGIGIGLAFRLALAGIPTSLLDWLGTAAFGMGIGFTLTLSIEFLTKAVLFLFPALSHSLPFHFLLSFTVGFGVFYSVTSYFRPFGFERYNIFPFSLAVGIFTAMTGLFFVFTWETEEKLRLEEENKELAILEERNRIARELHDAVAQNLFGMNLHLNAIDYLNERQPQDLPEAIQRLQEMVTEIQAKMRLMIYELKPAVFVGKGFFEALEELTTLFRTRYKLKISADYVGQEESLSSKAQTALYHVLQATLNNIARQAQASIVQIKLEITSDGSGRLIIYDDGQGLEGAKERNDQDNLRHLQKRIAEINGRMRIDTKTGKGTTITMVF